MGGPNAFVLVYTTFERLSVVRKMPKGENAA